MSSPQTSRRTVLSATAVLGGLGLLSACGSDESEGGSSSSGAASSGSSLLPAAEGKTTYPLTLKTAYGESTLTKRPTRIAVLGGFFDDPTVLDLGVTPVVTSVDPKDAWPWFDPYLSKLSKAVVVDPWSESSQAEKVASGTPDLIIAFSYDRLEDEFDKLKSIAPVLSFASAADATASDSVEKAVTEVARVLDIPSRATTVLAETDKTIAAARTKHPEWKGKTTSVLINYGQATGVMVFNGKGTPCERLLSELGFAKHPHADEFSLNAAGKPISLEKLKDVDADTLLVAQHGGRGKPADAIKWLEGLGVYKQLSAVKNKKVTYVLQDSDGKLPLAWAVARPSTLSNRWLVSEFEKAYAKVL